LSKIPGSGWDDERAEKVLKDVGEEVKGRKAYMTTDICTVIGQKPLSG
jgi:hypothetical protein